MSPAGRALKLCAAFLQVVAVGVWVLPQPVPAAAVRMPVVSGDGTFWLQPVPQLPPAPMAEAWLFPAQTQGCGSDCPNNPQQGSGSSPDIGPQAISPQATDRIARMFTDAREFCRYIDPLYRIDCLYAKFRRIAQDLPKTGDYAPVRAALVKAADRLEDVVDSYEDRSAPRIQPRLRSQPDAERIRPLSPIHPDRLAVANRAATEIVTELSTVLLRSSSGSERRQLAFQEIATAVDSTKVLLRSA